MINGSEIQNESPSENVLLYTTKQIENMFPGYKNIETELAPFVAPALAYVENIALSLHEWKKRGLDTLVSWQYATYLYQLGRLAAKEKLNPALLDRIFLLNKALHGLDLFYQIDMPRYFFLSHTNAAVFARADYGDYCVFHQSCTIGRKGDTRPYMEEGVVLYPQAMIIGRCHVRKNTVLAPGVCLIDQDTPGNCYVFQGENGKVRFKEINEIHVRKFFAIDENAF